MARVGGPPPQTYPRAALAGDVVSAARSLLGALLVSGAVTVRLTEVEAYAGGDDPASHAWRGLTPRTALMAAEAGLAYLYFSYGMHWCLNVTAGPVGTPAAVLLRAGEVVSGGEVVARRRVGIAARDWARGPGRLTRAVALDASGLGADLCAPDGETRLCVGRPPPPADIVAGPRVGVSRAADVPWRFHISGESSVSAYKRSPRATPPAQGVRLGDREP